MKIYKWQAINLTMLTWGKVTQTSEVFFYYTWVLKREINLEIYPKTLIQQYIIINQAVYLKC